MISLPRENTSLLIRSNNDDGSTNITDSSNIGHAITLYGDIQHKTDQYKFPQSSIYADGSGDRLSISAHSSLDTGTGAVSFGGWYRPGNKVSSYPRFMQLGTSWGADEINFCDRHNDYPNKFYIQAAQEPGYGLLLSSTTVTMSTWYFLLFCRDDIGNAYLFVNGALEDSATGKDFSINSADKTCWIFDSGTGGDLTQGHAEDIFVLKGYCLATESFAVPEKPLGFEIEKFIAYRIAANVEASRRFHVQAAQVREQAQQLRIGPSRRAERALNLLIDISTLYERALRLPITGYIGREAFQRLRISGALAQLEQYKNFTIEDFDRVYLEAFQRFSIYAGLAGLVKEIGVTLFINGSAIPFETGSGGDSDGVYFKVYEFTTPYNDLIRSLPDPTKSRPSAQIVWASEIHTEGGSEIVFDWVIELILDSITVSRVTDQGTKHTSQTATIRLVSPTAAIGWLDGNLGAAQITASWPSGTMATEILNDIFPDSLSYDLQLDDFPIGQQLDVDELYPNEIIPLFLIECAIHTANDGTMIIRNRPEVLGTVTPTHNLSSSDYEMSMADSDDQGQYRPNMIRVANYQEADSSQTLDAPEIVVDDDDPRKAVVYAYPVPFREVWLRSSHISHSGYTTSSGIVETIETIEQVEFLDGQASTSRPITGGFDSIDYGSNANLGTVTHNEDGTLTATIISRSLATVTYSTKRYMFQIADYDEHDLQLWFVDDEDL